MTRRISKEEDAAIRRAHMRSAGFVEYIPESHHSPFCSKAFGPLEDCPVCCDSGSDRNGGDALVAPGEASQSGAEGNRPPLSTERTPHAL